jgi:NAD(P)H-flavin reductase
VAADGDKGGEPRRTSRPAWYERTGRGAFETATQSISETGIPVPPGGTFQGRPPRGRRAQIEGRDDNGRGDLEERWSEVSRSDRRAEVTAVDWLTRTGTLRLGLEVTDDRPFSFVPGNFVRLERHVPGKGYRRGTYCIASPPSEYRRFELQVRLIPGGRMSEHLASLRLGDEVAFRGPTGRSMVRAAGGGEQREHDLVLLATGVGVGPFYSLAAHLLRTGFRRGIDLYWGLRTPDDICLTAQLDRLVANHASFRYAISLSQPPPGWEGLRGRITESVPPVLESLAGRRFLLAGNGAMIEEMAVALSEKGIPRETIYEEPYFNGRHVADRAVVAEIVSRFAAADVAPTLATEQVRSRNA